MTPGLPGRTPGLWARWARRLLVTSRGSRPTPETGPASSAVGGVLHAYTDSSQSAAEMISGTKSYNNGVNITDDGRIVTTLFHELQEQGWKVGTVTSVPFDHVSPAAMYAQEVDRDDYQDLAREMLGLPGIIQQARQAPLRPGLDVVMGTGFGVITNPKIIGCAGQEWRAGQLVHHRRRPRRG